MSRYIDADALKQQVESPYTEYPIIIQIRKALKDFIDDAPSIGICFCKECRYCYYDSDYKLYRCEEDNVQHWMYQIENHFCSYGKPIEELKGSKRLVKGSEKPNNSKERSSK